MLIYVGGYNLPHQPSIHALKITKQDQQWQCQPQATLSALDSASFLTFDHDNKQLYAVSEIDSGADQASGWVGQFDLTAPLEPQFVSKQLSQGSHPCHLALSKHGLICSNYSGGNVALFQLSGHKQLSAAEQVFQHTGSSIIEARQRQAHIHSAKVSPNGQWVVVADLGSDTLTTYGFDQTNQLQQTASFSMPAGSGPRHCAFHPDGTSLYVANELNNTISQLTISGSGELALIETLAATDNDTLSYPGEITLDSTGQFLYVSNRGDDSISWFEIDPLQHKLKYVSSCASGGQFPRHFALSPDEQFLVVANQQSNRINLLSRDATTGQLTLTDFSVALNAPACVCFVD
ncbi:lactonase family protein [Motilimonas eburnea]|uniref:lactonase family protein n=1 Tax=Motilimonas eburnea TaxID=1737488 RepID=UPI001E547DA1|nr:lactonase family protein [Motilimonas eburnea]MCE2571300.1 lactonase family protein [Motilimonas eburnea]